MIEALKQAMIDAKRNESYRNLAETKYWVDQYKRIAEFAIAEAEKRTEQESSVFIPASLADKQFERYYRQGYEAGLAAHPPQQAREMTPREISDRNVSRFLNEAQPAPVQPEQEPVSLADALHFAQWANEEKNLSNYILVGSLTLAGIEDGEYGQSEIDQLDNIIDALQERLVTGSEHKKVPLLAYIGAWNTTPPAQPQRKPCHKEFMEWAGKEGYDTAYAINNGKFIAHSPMTTDLWKAWQAAHGITKGGEALKQE
jgi:hypothetical protein